MNLPQLSSATIPLADADRAAARSGPKATLAVLRAVAVLHSLSMLAQPVLAGIYLRETSTP